MDRNQQFDAYSHRLWSRMAEKVEKIQQSFNATGLADTDAHRLADQLHRLTGEAAAAQELIPLVIERHRDSVVWGLERLLAAAARLEARPYADAEARKGLEERIGAVIALLDDHKLGPAEAAIRKLEPEVHELEADAVRREIRSLLADLTPAFTAAAA